ncbi:recombination associated protein RdgC [Pusillimonas noertemannii]|uniref:Recombination-associated protein RdgC n=1 Tax=Pusillimonas noertemannii TaxID=305977 RepID=A0A2U1CMK2_9BURK|nr:recombination-associated protein RdgC [Pusillimonas noertemannii]PVY62221.1 recombination associated protein RdgC [Pusillimonas noertemannii]TFL10799.1 recombination-associated protein RdgC [Pusillimonas noertemannii]
MWFKNLKVFRLSNWTLSADELAERLEKAAHKPIGASEMQSTGWVQPRDGEGFVHALDGQLLISLRAEQKLLPASVVNQVAKAKAQEIEEQQGYKPGRKQMKEIKEQVTDELLPKAFSSYRDTRAWIDTKNRWLVIDASSSTKSDEVLGMLAKAIDPFPVTPLYVEQSPAAAMTNWLIDDEAPANFSIDQDSELSSTSESRAAVRYVRQSIEIDDVRKHVQAGKQCTRLALTWADRVSFVLTEGLDIKRVTPLDVLRENQDSAAQNEVEQFDSDFTLMTGELARLIASLVEALGGEKATDTPAATVTSESIGDPDDEPYQLAVNVVLENKVASISAIQRHLAIGYNQAARHLERMERDGIVSAMEPNGHREILWANAPA